MSNPYPNRRRRRPGRKPLNRYSGRFPPPSARGYSGSGFKELWDLVLPWQGRDRRQFFNGLSSTIVFAGGVVGAVIGFSFFGFVGGLLGIAAGITAGGAIAERGRLYRR